jgi:hypothetical protein
MSAARIRSVFRRHNSAREEVFRCANTIFAVTRATAPVPVYAGEPQLARPRQTALDQHYQTAMKRELAKLGLL